LHDDNDLREKVQQRVLCECIAQKRSVPEKARDSSGARLFVDREPCTREAMVASWTRAAKTHEEVRPRRGARRPRVLRATVKQDLTRRTSSCVNAASSRFGGRDRSAPRGPECRPAQASRRSHGLRTTV